MENKAIEISEIEFGYYKNQIIFSNLSLDVNVGEYVCVIGHNGSGKSTLAKLLVGLNDVRKGEIKIFGQVLNEENI